MWISPWYRSVCPICRGKFHPTEAPLRSGTAPQDAHDEILKKFLRRQRSVEMAKVEPPPERGMFRRCWLDNSWSETHVRICPHCHLTLPLTTARAELEPQMIAIIGSKGSGKSCYFGMLIHHLMTNPTAHKLGLSVVPQPTFDANTFQDVSSQVIYDRIYGDTLLADPARVPAQTLSQVTEGTPIPLIFRLQFGDQKWWNHARGRCLEIAFFDTAGEDLDSEDVFDRHYGFLTQAAGLIFLIDPSSLPGVRDRMPKERRELVAPTTTRSTLVESLIRRFERAGVRANQRIAVPVAAALTKIDLLRMPGTQPPMYRPSVHDQGFARDDCQMVHHAVSQLLEENGQGHLIQQMRRFSLSTFLGVSALGNQPLPSGNILLTRNCIRVVDPLFWLLHQMGYLAARSGS